MEYMGLNEIREKFLSFFETKGHLRLPSFPLVPQGDASLLLINSGMAPMKPWFTGEQEPPRHRVTTCQKCVRTEDLDNIGKTDRHGTFFEMLGNFSFGDYFKREAIHWSWEFLTSPEWMGLDPNRLYPSVFAGSETTPADDEAWHIWHDEIGIPADRIFKFGKEDNFWEHGSGPCGPCSEIYYDRGEKYGCGKPGCTVGCDCDRYIEVWNNVFSQFNNDGEGNYTELKQKNIDTGMGLERLACVMQDVGSLFDTDTVISITNKVSEYTGVRYHEDEKKDVSLRIITDHIRASVMLISDGVLPSNEGRGYVLRRLLRRAARHSRLLGVDHPYLFDVCDTVIDMNEKSYPELHERRDYIKKIIRTEEENFARTIDGGMKVFGEMLAGHRAKNETVFSGADAFKLYDTYGFPVELTVEMLADEGMTVAADGFHELMQEQKQRARKAREALGDLGWAGIEFGKEIAETEFVGYENDVCDAKVLAIVADEELRDEIVAGAEAIVVLDRTTMYAEMGGQVGDHGTIAVGNDIFEVHDVQKNKGGKYMHYGVLKSGELKVGDAVKVSIDTDRRAAIRRAHSATHLLQKALRDRLGSHVEQAGSLVEPDHLRFDFTHFSAMTAEEIADVAREVNRHILAGLEIRTDVKPIEEAKKMGATALFGEKYGDVVRVVQMGDDYSVEFCGGTHLDNTAKVGPFHIVSEGSVASGVRRIEAFTGEIVLHMLTELTQRVNAVAAEFKSTPADLLERAKAHIEEMKGLRRELDKLKLRDAESGLDRYLMGARTVGELKVVTAALGSADANTLRGMGDKLRDKDPSIVAVLASTTDDKITFLAVCGKDAVAKGIKAGDLVREVCKVAGGSGGGKPDSAMGGGKDATKLDNALAIVDDFVTSKLG